MTKPKSRFVQWILVFIGSAGGPLLGVSSAIFASRLYHWLNHGKWLKTPTRKIMPDRWIDWLATVSDYIGIKNATFWILQQDFFVLIFFLGCLLGLNSVLQEWREIKKKKLLLIKS